MSAISTTSATNAMGTAVAGSAPPGPSVARGADRTAWVDVAKGISIAAVVLHHVVLSFVAHRWAPDAARELSTTLGTLRMPLFFLASGIFATRALAGPWGRLLERRVAFFAWLYVLWCVVRYVWFGLLTHGAELGAWPSPWAVVRQLWLPASAMWFLYALALFSLVGRATRAVPPVVRVGAAAVLAAVVSSGVVEVESYAWRSMALNLVFFLLGADLSAAIRRGAAALDRRAAVGLTACAGAVFVALTLALRDPGVVAMPGARLVTSLVALAAGVGAAVAVAGTPAGWAPQWLGTRTLEVYLLHGLAIGLLVRVGTAVHPGGVASLTGVVLVLVTTVLVVAACLTAARVLRAGRAGWLFAPPWHGPLSRAATAAWRRPGPSSGPSPGPSPGPGRRRTTRPATSA